MENLPPDPLLQAGAFIDPSYDDSTSAYPDPKPAEPSTPVHCSFGATATAVNSDATQGTNSMSADADAPDWLPPGWKVEYRMRSSGATAGHRDKYYYCPTSKRRFRSRKEVMNFLGIGETGSKKKKNDGTDGKSTPASNKRKKTPKASVENFNFHDVPEKVKWVLTDVNKGLWKPLVNGIDSVSESTKQEWDQAYKYLSLQHSGNVNEE